MKFSAKTVSMRSKRSSFGNLSRKSERDPLGRNNEISSQNHSVRAPPPVCFMPEGCLSGRSCAVNYIIESHRVASVFNKRVFLISERPHSSKVEGLR